MHCEISRTSARSILTPALGGEHPHTRTVGAVRTSNAKDVDGALVHPDGRQAHGRAVVTGRIDANVNLFEAGRLAQRRVEYGFEHIVREVRAPVGGHGPENLRT